MWGEHRTGEELKEKMEDDGGWDGLEDDFCFELDDDGRIANTAEHVDCSTAVSTIACLDGGAKEPEAEAASTLLRDLRTDCALADCGTGYAVRVAGSRARRRCLHCGRESETECGVAPHAEVT